LFRVFFKHTFEKLFGVAMPTYRVPRREIQFVMHEVLDMAQHYQSIPGAEEVDAEMIDAILEEGAKFAENEIAPT
jgi:hypothetical protein